MQPIVIRRAVPGDITLIRRLADEAFTATYRALLRPEQLDYMLEWMYAPETLLREMQEGFAWFVAYAGEEPCGYLSVQQESGGLFHLQKIYLLPRFQGGGAGRQLFECAVAWIREVHPAPCRMELNVNRGNKALEFYEHLGMRKLREGDFPIGGGYFMNDYILGLDIE